MDLSAAEWRKSSYSGGNGCVEVARVGDWVALRDDRDRSGAVLVVPVQEWDAFVAGVRDGEFEDL